MWVFQSSVRGRPYGEWKMRTCGRETKRRPNLLLVHSGKSRRKACRIFWNRFISDLNCRCTNVNPTRYFFLFGDSLSAYNHESTLFIHCLFVWWFIIVVLTSIAILVQCWGNSCMLHVCTHSRRRRKLNMATRASLHCLRL